MTAGTNQAGMKMLIKNNGSFVLLFLINYVFWTSRQFFVTLGMNSGLRANIRCFATCGVAESGIGVLGNDRVDLVK